MSVALYLPQSRLVRLCRAQLKHTKSYWLGWQEGSQSMSVWVDGKKAELACQAAIARTQQPQPVTYKVLYTVLKRYGVMVSTSILVPAEVWQDNWDLLQFEGGLLKCAQCNSWFTPVEHENRCEACTA